MGTTARLKKRIKHQVNELLEDATNIAECFALEEESNGILADAREYFTLHVTAMFRQATNKLRLARRLEKYSFEDLFSRFGSYGGYYLSHVTYIDKTLCINVICLEPDEIFLDQMNDDLTEEEHEALERALRNLK